MISSTQPRKIAAHYLLQKGQLIKNPIVTIDSSGQVLDVSFCAEVDSHHGVEFYSGILMAGMVNAHSHLELSAMQGAIEPHTGFVGFAKGIASLRGTANEEQRLRAIAYIDAKMWQEGVSVVGDISNSTISFATKNSSRVLYRSFAEVFGLWAKDCSAVEPLLQNPRTSLTPHSLYSLQDGVLRDIAARAGDATLSIHFMESPSEVELFEHRGEMWEWYEQRGLVCDFLHYGSPVERLVGSLDRGRRVMLVHNCMVTQEDVERVESHFEGGVTWCLCPRSNSYISQLRPPVEMLWQKGVNVAVGSDSLSSNWSISMVEELRALGESVPLAVRLDWATRGGAKALGLEGEFGDVEVGRRCGLVCLSGVDLGKMQLTERSRTERIV